MSDSFLTSGSRTLTVRRITMVAAAGIIALAVLLSLPTRSGRPFVDARRISGSNGDGNEANENLSGDIRGESATVGLDAMLGPDHLKRAVGSLVARMRAANGSLPNGAEQPLVAVCLVGAGRTLPAAQVYRTIKTNLIDALSENTIVFAHIKLWDADVKRQEKYGNFRPISTSPSELSTALRFLQPHQLILEEKKKDIRNKKCPLSREWALSNRRDPFFAGKEEERFVGQVHAMFQCYQSVIEFEGLASVKFDAIVKTRPDTVWFFPCFSAQELLMRENLVTHFQDIFIFSPRKFADGFASWWTEYRACTEGPWKGAYIPEHAFGKAFSELNATYYNDQKIPVAIRRLSGNESSAFEQCEKQRRISQQACMDLVYEDE